MAGPLFQRLSLKGNPVQAVPRFSPVSRYFQTEPVAMSERLVVEPAMTVSVRVLASLRGGEPLSLTRMVRLLVLGVWAGFAVQLKRPLVASIVAPLGAPASRL